jgi:hypothetical protein
MTINALRCVLHTVRMFKRSKRVVSEQPLGGGRELAAVARYALWTGLAALVLVGLCLALLGHS